MFLEQKVKRLTINYSDHQDNKLIAEELDNLKKSTT
jgi:hypothetical protein